MVSYRGGGGGGGGGHTGIPPPPPQNLKNYDVIISLKQGIVAVGI